MPKRKNVQKTRGGADITDLNELHTQLVGACKQALDNEIASGEIKPATINSIRQVCADAGVAPSRQATSAMEEISYLLPKLDMEQVTGSYRQ